MTLGFDTSNYTTSCACFDGINGENRGRLLPVPEGGLGLRQSDAVFHHVRALPELLAQLSLGSAPVAAVGASVTPRRAEGSYMPCFLVGSGAARQLAAVQRMPFYEFSHQEGHIAAALWSAGRMDLIKTPHLAWHLSGGTTELLYVQPAEHGFQVEIVGGTNDISAGQLIDRIGVALGMQFPAGREMDALASGQSLKQSIPRVKTNDGFFSLSGMENKVKQSIAAGLQPQETANLTLRIVIGAIEAATKQVQARLPGLPLVFSGGVASSRLLRDTFSQDIFATPECSTDNALGIAVLTYLSAERDGLQ